MGYIPGLLVIFGGCFLWGILVHSTLKGKWDFLKQQLAKVKDTVAERDRILQALFNEVTPLDLDHINSKYLIYLQSLTYNLNSLFVKEEHKAFEWVNKLVHALIAKGYPEQNLRLLEDISSKLKMELKDYQKAAKSYNQLIESKPTSFMASALKFEKVAL